MGDIAREVGHLKAAALTLPELQPQDEDDKQKALRQEKLDKFQDIVTAHTEWHDGIQECFDLLKGGDAVYEIGLLGVVQRYFGMKEDKIGTDMAAGRVLGCVSTLARVIAPEQEEKKTKSGKP